MTLARTVYARPILGEPLDVSAVFEATLDALEDAPRRYGDEVPIRAAYSRRSTISAVPATECDDADVPLPERLGYATSQDATLVDWSECK